MEEQQQASALFAGENPTPTGSKQQAPEVPRSSNEVIPAQQRLKTACSQCRQQKIKCRAHYDLATPCERCARMKLTCVYEPRHSRGRLRSDSEAANETPKRRLVARSNGKDAFGSFAAVNLNPNSRPGPDAPDVGDTGRRISTVPELPYAPGRAISSAASAPYGSAWDTRASATGPTAVNAPQNLDSLSNYQSTAHTLPRSIGGLRFDAETIDNLFGQFFKSYHPFMPILDPTLRPNEYYAQSSFLFWSILAVASRRWPKDSSLICSMRSKVLTHAMTSIFSPTIGSSSITAILLLLNWSFPEAQTYDEMPYVLSSALVHAALRLGMNTPDAMQDFSRAKVSLSDAECSRRFQIYSYCLILYQRSSCCMGNSLGEIPTCFSPPVQPYVSSLPTSLSLQIELSDTLVGATMLVAKAKFDLTDHVGVAAFERVLQNHSKELETCRSRQSTSLTAMDRLYLSISRLILHTLHFFKSPSEKHFHAWRYPFDDACALIHGLHDLEKSMHIDLYGPSFVYHGVLLAACTILRCLKTPFADTIGRESSTAQALFFSAINMIRNISIVEGDKAAKSAWALQHLWRSDTVYKRSNGSWDLDLRVKGRFSSSVIYDTMWWSRSEFIGQTNGYSMKKSGPPPGTAWSNSEADRFTADNSGFEPDLFADMVFTQDWILSDWEVSSSTMNSNHVPEAVPSAHALQ